MSGPKASSYELSLQRQCEILQRQQAELKRRMEEEERQRRIVANRAAIAQCKKKVLEQKREMQTYRDRVAGRALAMKESFNDSAVQDYYANTKSFVDRCTEAERNASDQNAVNECLQEAKKLQEKGKGVFCGIQLENDRLNEINRQAILSQREKRVHFQNVEKICHTPMS